MKLPCPIISEAPSGYSYIRQAWLEYCVYLSWENWLVERIRHKLISMFYLKPSDCCNRKVRIAKEGPAEMGQCCSEPTSVSALTLVPSAPLSRKGWVLDSSLGSSVTTTDPQILHFLKGSNGLNTHAGITWGKWCEKSILHKRSAPGKIYKERDRSHTQFPLFWWPQIWTIHSSRKDMRSNNWWPFSFSFFHLDFSPPILSWQVQ